MSMIAMEARSTTSLDDLKASLLQASSQGDLQGFPTLQNSLKDVLDGYSQAQKGSAAAGHLEEDVATFNDTVSKARQQLQAKCELLQEAVDGARAMVEDAGDFPVEASADGVRALLAHSHKLSYTSFAPLLGMHLVDPHRGVYMPPFPQTVQLQQTFLKQYAQEKADAEAARKAGTAAAQAAEQAKVAAVAGGVADIPIPSMPPGWKPGDPIIMEPRHAPPGIPLPDPAAKKPAEVGPPVLPEEVPLNVNLDLDDGIDDDFILNAEAVEASDDDSSEEDDDDEEHPPGTTGTDDVEEEEEEGKMDTDDD